MNYRFKQRWASGTSPRYLKRRGIAYFYRSRASSPISRSMARTAGGLCLIKRGEFVRSIVPVLPVKACRFTYRLGEYWSWGHAISNLYRRTPFHGGEPWLNWDGQSAHHFTRPLSGYSSLVVNGLSCAVTT